MKIPEDIKITLICRKCKKRIPTRLVNGELEGNFLASDCIWSEVLDIPVVVNGDVICYNCLTQ